MEDSTTAKEFVMQRKTAFGNTQECSKEMWLQREEEKKKNDVRDTIKYFEHTSLEEAEDRIKRNIF